MMPCTSWLITHPELRCTGWALMDVWLWFNLREHKTSGRNCSNSSEHARRNHFASSLFPILPQMYFSIWNICLALTVWFQMISSAGFVGRREGLHSRTRRWGMGEGLVCGEVRGHHYWVCHQWRRQNGPQLQWERLWV